MTEVAAPPVAAAPAAPPASPYKGLVPYGEEDAEFFFGRESERRIIAANLLASRLTLLYGPSGVGKTSLLLAGVVHDLRAAARRDLAARGEVEYAVVVFRSWRDDPVAGLNAAVADAVRELPGGEAIPPAGSLAEALEEWTRRLDAELLVVLDQFEEYFLYHEREDGPGTFAEEFPRAVNRAGLRASFLVSVREDELAKLDRFKGRIPGLFDNYLRVEHLGEEAARAAVVEPLERWAAATGERVAIEGALVDEVLSQVQTGAVEVGQTGGGTAAGVAAGPRRFEAAYLQLVLTRLWDEERAAGSAALRLATLRRLGGAQQIVDDRLVEAVRALPPGEEATAARIFHFLVSKSGTKIALSAADLAEFASVPETAVAAVLEALAAQRILRPIAPPAGASTGTRYELFHDKLAPAVLGWRARYADEQARLEAEELARRQVARARRYRTFAGALGAAAFGVAVLAGWAVTQQHAANDQKQAAQAQGLAAGALAELAVDPQVAVLLARDSLRVHRTAEGESALRQALPEARMRVLLQPPGGVLHALLTPDGRLVVTAGGGSADVWDARTGRHLRGVRTGAASGLAVSSDGRWFAAFGGGRGAIRSVATGRTATALPTALLAAFAPSSDRLAVWGGHGLEIWGPQGRVELVGVVHQPTRLAWSPNGRLLAVGLGDDTVAVFDVVHRRRLLVLGTPSELAATTSVAFSRDGRLVAVASESGVARVWRAATGQLVARLRGHQGSIGDLGFSPRSDRVVTASDDGTARIWNARTGATIAELRGHTGPVRQASFSPGGKFVVTAGDTTARVWDAQTGRLVSILRGDTDFVTTAAFGSDGHTVVTASADGTARVWDATSGALVFGGHSDRVYSVDVSRDGKSVLTASRDGTARVWELSTGRELYPPIDATGSVRQAIFDPRGGGVVLASGDAIVFAGFPPRIGSDAVLGGALSAVKPGGGAVAAVAGEPRGSVAAGSGSDVDVVSGSEEVQRVGRHAAAVRAVAFSPDGRTLASGSKDGTARLWDVRSRRLVRVLAPDAGPVDGVAWGPGGTRLATAQGRARAIVWDARSGRRLLELHHPSGVVVTSVAYSPDGHLIATGASDRLVRVFDARRGDLVAELAGHTGLVWSVRFSPGGGAIVSASRDGTARVWPAVVFAPYSRLLRGADAQIARGATPDERAAFRQLAAAQS